MFPKKVGRPRSKGIKRHYRCGCASDFNHSHELAKHYKSKHNGILPIGSYIIKKVGRPATKN